MNTLPAAIAATTLAAVAALSGCGSHRAPVAAPSHTPAPAPSTTGTATHPPVLGPDGFGRLTLGTSYKLAMATGEVVAGGRGPHLAGHRDAGICLSKADGVMAIFLGRGMRTSEGLRLGSTAAEMVRAYPQVRPFGPDSRLGGPGIFRTPSVGGAWYEIDVNQRHRVYVVILRQDHQTCFE